jgi:hypothetical protein
MESSQELRKNCYEKIFMIGKATEAREPETSCLVNAVKYRRSSISESVGSLNLQNHRKWEKSKPDADEAGTAPFAYRPIRKDPIVPKNLILNFIFLQSCDSSEIYPPSPWLYKGNGLFFPPWFWFWSANYSALYTVLAMDSKKPSKSSRVSKPLKRGRACMNCRQVALV